ncbi:MAG: signal peptidase II [Clostridia bacterium]|nr:signal peptidase II [Clostridia bacterium]
MEINMVIIYILIGLVFLLSDFFTKQYILANVPLGETFGSFTSLINFTYIQNKGAAFSLLNGRLELLSLISVVFCIAIIVYIIIKKPTHKLLCISLSMLLSGALGNAIDRIFYGFVVDFIETTFVDFAIFNIADIAITVGAILLAIYAIFFDKDAKNG